jgi:hypothetical protein
MACEQIVKAAANFTEFAAVFVLLDARLLLWALASQFLFERVPYNPKPPTHAERRDLAPVGRRIRLRHADAILGGKILN